MGLETVEEDFFLFLLKVIDREILLRTLGDVLGSNAKETHA